MLKFFMEITEKPVTLDELRALYPQKRNLFQALASAESIVDRRLVRVLAGLNGGLKSAVVTSSNRIEVEPILKQAELLDVLSTVVYGNDVKNYKPHPEPYQIALARLGVQPSEAVVFEDSISGVRSGRDAGCRVVTVKSPTDLLALVEGTLSGRVPGAV
jgi:HAD superfamily hydrolase (TIGR01509 family)